MVRVKFYLDQQGNPSVHKLQYVREQRNLLTGILQGELLQLLVRLCLQREVNAAHTAQCVVMDNKIVVFHDYTLGRMCGIDLPLETKTYEELQMPHIRPSV